MPGSFPDYLENRVLNHFFGATASTAPATLYLGLSTTTIADDGTNITEPSGNGYARVAVTNNSTNFPAASGGSKSNGAIFTFPQASGSWGTIIDFFLSDASSAGNLFGYGTFSVAKAISSGDTLSIQIGQLTLTVS